MSDPKWEGGQEVQTNWFKFEKVGDGVKGTLIAKRFQPSNAAGYQDQHVYELRQEDGKVVNVGISVAKKGTCDRLNNCKLGEIVGVLFEKEGEKVKGKFPAKFLKVMTFGMDPEYKDSLDQAVDMIDAPPMEQAAPFDN